MIKINLLPFRLARKKENIRRQISIFFLLIFFSIAVLFWYTQMINNQILSLNNDIQQVGLQIGKYKEKADRVAQIQKDLKALDDKLSIISSLKQQKDRQLILFDGMTDLVVQDRMWLEQFDVKNNAVTIKGIAYDNPTVAQFMEVLESSELFYKVDLKTSKQKKIQNDILLKEFELFCLRQKPEPESDSAAGKAKNGRKK